MIIHVQMGRFLIRRILILETIYNRQLVIKIALNHAECILKKYLYSMHMKINVNCASKKIIYYLTSNWTVLNNKFVNV